MYRFLTLVVTAVTLTSVAVAQPAAPRYVILMIGDGMGWPQVQLAESYLGAQAQTFRAPLRMTTLPVAGLVRTHSATAHVTDSGAAGTALACGIKTANGYIGMDTNYIKYASLAALAQRHGRKVGLVTTDSIVGATPSVFYAHRPDRWSTYPIGVDLFRSGIDVCVGAGGFEDPLGLAIPTNTFCALTNELADLVVPGNPATNATGITWRDLYSLTSIYGYTWINTPETWHALSLTQGKVIAVLDIPYGIAVRTGALTLAEVTRKTITLLDNPSGFFLMVEGARIDKMGHVNDAAANLGETLAFDDAVAAAYDFYTNHPNETLLIVTADHETGGMTIGHGANHFAWLGRQHGRASDFQKAFDAYRATHTLRSRPGRWWAALTGGEDAGKARALFDDIKPLLREYFGFGAAKEDVALSSLEWRQLEHAFEDSMGGRQLYPDDESFRAMYGGQDPLTITATRILAAHAGVRWTTFDHSAADVPIFAAGVGSAWFNGLHDNTDIPRYIMRVMLPEQHFPVPLN